MATARKKVSHRPPGLGFIFWIPPPRRLLVMCFTFAVPTGEQAPIVDGADHMSLATAVVVLVIAITGVSVIRRVATVEPAWVTQPLNREQPLSSTTEAGRLSERQQLNKYFLQNWRDRPTRLNLD
jgi:hypothetical protein